MEDSGLDSYLEGKGGRYMAQGNDLRMVYMTMESMDQARKIGKALVQERLAACVNIIPGMASIYRWKGDIEEAEEIVMLAKTSGDRVSELSARVQELHSYDCPCIVSMALKEGNPEYLCWLEEETRNLPE